MEFATSIGHGRGLGTPTGNRSMKPCHERQAWDGGSIRHVAARACGRHGLEEVGRTEDTEWDRDGDLEHRRGLRSHICTPGSSRNMLRDPLGSPRRPLGTLFLGTCENGPKIPNFRVPFWTPFRICFGYHFLLQKMKRSWNASRRPLKTFRTHLASILGPVLVIVGAHSRDCAPRRKHAIYYT